MRILGIHRPNAVVHRSRRGIEAWGVLLTQAVDDLRSAHDLGPMATAVCSRLAISSYLLSRVIGGSVTVGVAGDGFLGAAWARSCRWGVKGFFTENPHLETLVHSEKLDVEAAVGSYGFFEVRSRRGEHVVPLGVGGIAEETAEYLDVYLGRSALVLVSEYLTREGVRGAGGVLLLARRRLLECEVEDLYRSVAHLGPLSDRLRIDAPPQTWVESILAAV